MAYWEPCTFIKAVQAHVKPSWCIKKGCQMFRAEILASFVTAVFFLCTSFWAKSCPLNMACAWRKNALPNCLLGNEGSYLSLSHWYCNFTLSSLAVELLLVIYDMHVSFSLEFFQFEWPDEEGKGRAVFQKEMAAGGGGVSCAPNRQCCFCAPYHCPPPHGAGFC